MRFLRLLRLAVWRAFGHDALSIAEGIGLLVHSYVLSRAAGRGLPFLQRPGKCRRICEKYRYALGRHPSGGRQHRAELSERAHRAWTLVATSLLSLWTASGVHGFLDGRASGRCYEHQNLGIW